MHLNNLKKFYFIDEFNKDHLKNLDNNTAIIYRNYTKKYDQSLIFKIKKFCKSKNLKFFLANDINLAIKLRLDGIYVPAFNKRINIIKAKLHDLMCLGSAHNIKEINEKKRQGVDLIFLAPIFKVNKKKHFLGVNKFNHLAMNKKISFIALGGINETNIKKINLLNCYGFAGIRWIKKNGLRKLRPFLNCLNSY